jgi:hypothetical protein
MGGRGKGGAEWIVNIPDGSSALFRGTMARCSGERWRPYHIGSAVDDLKVRIPFCLERVASAAHRVGEREESR